MPKVFIIIQLIGDEIMTFSKRLKEARENKGITLAELGRLINKTEATVQRYESGNIKNLKNDTIESIAKALNISPSYLMGWDNEKNNQSVDVVKNLEEQGIIINFSDYDGFEKLTDEEKLEFQKKIEEAVQFELFKRNNNKK